MHKINIVIPELVVNNTHVFGRSEFSAVQEWEAHI